MKRYFFHLTSYLFLLTATLFFLTSCEYKELCYDHSHWAEVRVVFDWTGNVTKSSLAPEVAGAGMTVLFYNMEQPGAEPIRYDLPGRQGGTVRLLPGTYRALAYNYDTETILYRGMEDISALEAYTRVSSIEEGTQLSRSGMPRATQTENEPVILEPDPLWGASSEAFTLMLDEKDVNGTIPTTVITMHPTSRVYEVTVNIHNVPNLQYTSQIGGALSGLAPSVWMESAEVGEGAVTEAFTAAVVDEQTLQMHFRIFGHCPHLKEGDANSHQLTVYAILADGSKWYYIVDVTDQMHGTVPDPDHDDHTIDIEVDGLPIPKPIVNGSGFQPTIDGWQGIEIEVGM